MNTYTIKGKKYSEFDINKRCAEIGSRHINKIQSASLKAKSSSVLIGGTILGEEYNPCTNWIDAGPITEKCFDELMKPYGFRTRWQYLMRKHNCTKLVAACICLIELNP